LTTSDIRQAAAPRIAYDFIESAPTTKSALRRTRRHSATSRIVPRYLVGSIDGICPRCLRSDLIQPRRHSPHGHGCAFPRGADMMLASAAREANVPFILSGPAPPPSRISRARRRTWLVPVLFDPRPVVAEDKSDGRPMRPQDLVLTVDVPEASKRERNIRNGGDAR